MPGCFYSKDQLPNPTVPSNAPAPATSWSGRSARLPSLCNTLLFLFLTGPLVSMVFLPLSITVFLGEFCFLTSLFIISIYYNIIYLLYRVHGRSYGQLYGPAGDFRNLFSHYQRMEIPSGLAG